MRHTTPRLRGTLRRLAGSPTFRLLGALALGALVGIVQPAWTHQLTWIPETFIRLARLLAYPLVLASVAHGLALIGSTAQLRRLGWRAAVCTEGLALAALVFGMGAAWLFDSGSRLQGVIDSAADVPFHVSVPSLGLGTLVAVLAAAALLAWWVFRHRDGRTLAALDAARTHLLALLRGLVLLAPLAAFASAASLAGAHGWRVLAGLAEIVFGLYFASVAFVVLVLGTVCLACRTSLLALLASLKDEVLLTIGTSASVSAMGGLMARLEQMGCASGAVRMLVPLNFVAGLNGSALYLGFMLVALLHAAQIDLSAWQYVQVAALAAVTVKGACGVAGSAYVALGLTLSGLPAVPAEGLTVLFGLERLLKCRSVTNLVGNAVTCVAACTWSGLRARYGKSVEEPQAKLVARFESPPV